jgi:resorcinol 4-hydroxylase (FADH2)
MAMHDGTPDTPQDLITRAKALTPGFLARQEQTESDRRVSQASIDECISAGLYRSQQPVRYGGLEHDLDDFAELCATVASGCGSTGWVYSVSSQHQWLVGMYDPEAQDEIWGDDPTAIAASSFSPSGRAVPVDGGFRLTGTWMYCSGILNCGWIILGTRIVAGLDGDQIDQGYILVATNDLTIEDNWHVAGLAGTGSMNASCEDLFVPARRFLKVEDALSGNPPGAAVNTGPLWRIPFFSAISVCLASATIGMAMGAYDQFVGETRRRVTRGAALSQPVPMAEIPSIQHRVGEAASCIDAARLMLARDCRDIMATMRAGDSLTLDQRARNKGNLGFAQRLAIRAVDRLFEASGGGGLFAASPVQRFWRDAHAGGMHISINRDIVGGIQGRVAMGMPAGTTQL